MCQMEHPLTEHSAELPESEHFKPVLASLLMNRTETALIFGAGVVHAGLVIAGLPAWECPIRAVTGVPCPGCGLSRAISALVHGDYRTAMSLHIFAPLFLLAFALMGIVLVLPELPRKRVIDMVRVVEQQTGIVVLLLIGLMVYWGLRLFWLGFGIV